VTNNPCPRCHSDNTRYEYPDEYSCLSCQYEWRRSFGSSEVTPKHDPVNHPKHYTSHPSGVEVIEITRWEVFNRGNAIKYILRAGKKDGADEIEDLKKARFYLDDEITRLESLKKDTPTPS
jgi:transposase-like protein